MNFFEGEFIYNNIESSKYGLAFMQIDTTSPNFVGGNLNYNKLKVNNKFNTSIQSANLPEELISFEIEMIGENVLSNEEIREVTNAYFNHLTYKKLYSEKREYEDIYYYCIMKDVTKIYQFCNDGYGVCGFKCTVELDGEFAWRNEKKTSFTQAQLNNNIVLHFDSDIRDYYYPKIEVQLNSFITDVNDALDKKKLRIQCLSDNNRLSEINGVRSADTITFSISPKLVNSTSGADYLADFNKNWVRFIQGFNNFNIGIYDKLGNRINNGVKSVKFIYKEGLIL